VVDVYRQAVFARCSAFEVAVEKIHQNVQEKTPLKHPAAPKIRGIIDKIPLSERGESDSS